MEVSTNYANYWALEVASLHPASIPAPVIKVAVNLFISILGKNLTGSRPTFVK